MDHFGRTIDYMRISMTDRCNERCLYCMPEGYRGWAQRADHLTGDEIITIVETATQLGFRKFRITGGEPLVRQDVVAIIERIWNLPGVQALGLSTNATRLAPIAQALKQAGVRSVNISLDALTPAVYRQITGGRIESVLEGIQAAITAPFEMIKLNCVLMRNLNETEIWPLIHFAAQHQVPLRFIELMPLSNTEGLDASHFLSIQEVMQNLAQHDRLIPMPDYRPGHGPARYYRMESTGATVGFIGAMTTEHFCETCNKLRLTADGKLRPCLGHHGEINLLNLLRNRGDLRSALQQAIANKPQKHDFTGCYHPERPMTAIGG